MIKKIFNIILICAIFLSFISFNNVYALDDNNTLIINEVDKLEGYAKDYITSSGSTATSTELVFQYLRRSRYNDSKWSLLLGAVDTNFVTYVDSLGGVNITNNSYLVDNGTEKRVDFIHMIAALNCYYKNGDSVKLGGFITASSDYAGWAGDLISYLEEINTYRTTNSITDFDALLKYSNELLGTNKSSMFGSDDMLADLDALNLFKSTDIDLSDFSDALDKYYVKNSSTYNSTNRVASARNYIGTDETAIINKSKSLISNTLVLNVLASGLSSKLTSVDYDVVTKSFANYMLEKSYIELLSNSGTITVGEPVLQVNLYESNLGVPKITLSNDICNVEILNDIMYIEPVLGGNTTITISSFNNTKTVTYNLTINNVAPSIVNDLEESYDLESGKEFTFNVNALGTNNIYIWYIGDTKDGTFTKIGETNSPSFKLNPTADMNNKYIKCEVGNTGNSSVTTKAALLKVTDVTNGGNVNAGDNILYSVILLILGLGLSVKLLKKEN